MKQKQVEHVCGRCNSHRKVLCGLISEWQCTNKQSERYGWECDFYDTCEYWNQDGPYLAQPIIKYL